MKLSVERNSKMNKLENFGFVEGVKRVLQYLGIIE